MNLSAILGGACCAAPRGPAESEDPVSPKDGGGGGGGGGFSIFGEDKDVAKVKREVAFVEAWLEKRQVGDIEGATRDCTQDISIESPGSTPVVGLDIVKDKIFGKAAPKPMLILQPVQAKSGAPGVYWRMAVFEFSKGKHTKVRRTWHLAYEGGAPKIQRIVLEKMPERVIA